MKEGMFDNQKNTVRVVQGLVVTCVLLFLADGLVHKDHVHYPCESYFGFYAVYGFVSCVILVLIAKYVLRPLVMREEDYYD